MAGTANGDAERSSLLFLGVRTEGTLAERSFDTWMSFFGAHCSLTRIDLPADADPAKYVALLERMRREPSCVGMQITSHKLRLYEAARSQLDDVSEEATELEEIGALVCRRGELCGISPDYAAVVQEFEDEQLGSLRGDLVILGCGGAARAVALAACRLRRFTAITMTESDETRRVAGEAWARRLGAAAGNVDLQVVGADAAHDAVRSAAAESLIVNATGMGKDVPGSPLSDMLRFPHGSVAWDLNYRGDRTFLNQAEARRNRDVSVRDGFSMFVRNWVWLLEMALQTRLGDLARAELLRKTVELRAKA